MANLELTGKLIQKLAVQSGQSSKGPWSKQEFILEITEGNFPVNVAFSVWGEDKVKELESLPIGVQIRVAFNIISREWNGKWYTDLRAWRLSSTIDSPKASEDVPVGEPMYSTSNSIDDDLPF